MTSLLTWVKKPIKPAAVVVVFLMVAMISLLVWENYRSHVKLRQSSLARFEQDTNNIAITASYFFSECKYDLKDLAAGQEVFAFFENKPGGMSTAQGGQTTTEVIAERFERLLKEKMFHGDPIYHRAVLVDES